MTVALKALPAVIAVAAIVLVLVQGRSIDRLERQLDKVEKLATSKPEPAGPTAARPAESGSMAALERRVERLEQRRASRVEDRRVATTSAPTREPEGRVGEAPPEEEIESLRADVDALLTGEGLDTDEGRAKIKALIDKERSQRRLERDAMRREMEKLWLTEFAEEAGLDDEQKAALEGLSERRRELRSSLREQFRAGEISAKEMRDRREEARAAMEKELQEVLTPAQLAAFEERRQNMRNRGARGRLGPPGR